MDVDGAGTATPEFGPWLKEQRTRCDMSQDVAGRAAGRSGSWWRNLEWGRQRPSPLNVVAVARALACDDAVVFAAAGMPLPGVRELELLRRSAYRPVDDGVVIEIRGLVDELGRRDPRRLHTVAEMLRAMLPTVG